MGELVRLSDDLNVITAEIQSYKQIAGQSIFEIGRRLKHVKENDLVHGEWISWLESIDMNRKTAHRFITVYDRLPEDVSSMGHLGVTALYEIATLPEEEREKEHVTSKGETKTPDEMTVRELQELKRQLKKEKERRGKAEERFQMMAREKEKVEYENEELKNKPPEVKEVEVVPDDVLRRLEQYERELAEKKDKILNVEKQQEELELLKEKLEKTSGVEKELREVKKELDEKQTQLDTLSMEQVKTKNKRLIYQNVSYLTRDIGGWIRRTKQYINERDSLSGDPEIHRTIEGLKKTLQETLDEVSSWTEVGGGDFVEEIGGEVIDADFSEVE